MTTTPGPVRARGDGEVKWLVCEGQCNPNFGAYADAEERYLQQHYRSFGAHRPPSADDMAVLVMAARGLAHTGHSYVGPHHGDGRTSHRYQCLQCGHTRKYGVEARW